MTIWRTIFDGTVEGRPVKLKEYGTGDERELKVETNYNEDQIIGDAPGVVGVPVAASDQMDVYGDSAEDLEQRLVEEGGFSAAGAKEIARYATLPSA